MLFLMENLVGQVGNLSYRAEFVRSYIDKKAAGFPEDPVAHFPFNT
jgi:hypothetical protein